MLVDPGQLENAILNLCLNSAHAIERRGKISITVRTSGDMAFLTVADDGCGMSPDIADRAFEPFFSASPNVPGAGLGLSMVFGFVKQSGGDISICTRAGRGTSICMVLPVIAGGAGVVPSGSRPSGGRSSGGRPSGGRPAAARLTASRRAFRGRHRERRMRGNLAG